MRTHGFLQDAQNSLFVLWCITTCQPDSPILWCITAYQIISLTLQRNDIVDVYLQGQHVAYWLVSGTVLDISGSGSQLAQTMTVFSCAENLQELTLFFISSRWAGSTCCCCSICCKWSQFKHHKARDMESQTWKEAPDWIQIHQASSFLSHVSMKVPIPPALDGAKVIGSKLTSPGWPSVNLTVLSWLTA